MILYCKTSVLLYILSHTSKTNLNIYYAHLAFSLRPPCFCHSVLQKISIMTSSQTLLFKFSKVNFRIHSDLWTVFILEYAMFLSISLTKFAPNTCSFPHDWETVKQTKRKLILPSWHSIRILSFCYTCHYNV